MIRRTTVELDYDLVSRAQAVLHCSTVRATIHEALRRALDSAEADDAPPLRGSTAAVLLDAQTMHEHLDLEVLASDDMRR